MGIVLDSWLVTVVVQNYVLILTLRSLSYKHFKSAFASEKIFLKKVAHTKKIKHNKTKNGIKTNFE